MSTFEDFLNRNTNAIIAAYTQTVTETTPILPQEDVFPYTTRLVHVFISIGLGKELIQDGAAVATLIESRKRGVAPENSARRANSFRDVLRNICATDTALSETERKHIERMIDQAHRYLRTVVTVRLPNQTQ